MNKYFNYDSINMWDDSVWQDRMGYVGGLVEWMTENYMPYYNSTGNVVDDSRFKDFNDMAYYNSTTFAIDSPEEIRYWEEKGIKFESRNLGGSKWVSMVPVEAYDDRMNKLKTLVVLHQTSYKDDNKWPMRLIEYYSKYNEAAAKEKFIVIYIADEGVYRGQLPNIVLESADLFPVDVNNVWLDLSVVYGSGKKLSDIKGFAPVDENGPVTDTDAMVKKFSALEIPAVNISRLWQKRDGMYPFLITRMHNPTFDYERFLRTEAAKKMADATLLEYKYDTPDDPEMLKHWDDMGAKYEAHDHLGERWVTLAPKSAYEDKDTKLPLMIIMQEVPYCNDHLILTAFSQYYDFCRLAAQGDLILLFFARESFDLNDMLADIIEDAKAIYPIDARRVYVAGHSHNGFYTEQFSIRNRNVVTAFATLGDQPGLFPPSGNPVIGPDGKPKPSGFNIPDEQVEYMSTYDMPHINIAGCCEHRTIFPINQDNPYPFGGIATASDSGEIRIISWQRRLKFANCPIQSTEAIKATTQSKNRIERIMGFPADRTNVIYAEGAEHYIADIKNNDGNYHLRMVAMENMPHIPTPFMNILAWSFLRGFARDPETGKIIELC